MQCHSSEVVWSLFFHWVKAGAAMLERVDPPNNWRSPHPGEIRLKFEQIVDSIVIRCISVQGTVMLVLSLLATDYFLHVDSVSSYVLSAQWNVV